MDVLDTLASERPSESEGSVLLHAFMWMTDQIESGAFGREAEVR